MNGTSGISIEKNDEYLFYDGIKGRWDFSDIILNLKIHRINLNTFCEDLSIVSLLISDDKLQNKLEAIFF